MRAFIYTGGTVYSEFLTEKPSENDLVICADSGWKLAKKLGIKPQIILGDFDSSEEPPHDENTKIMRFPIEKNDTDTQLAVKVALENGATEILMIGGLEGRLDHTLSFLGILEFLYKKHIPAKITSGKNRVTYLENNSTLIGRGHFKFLGLLAVTKEVKGVTIEGVKYPLKNAKLSRENQYAISNELTGNCAYIEVKKGAIYIVESTD